MKILVINAGSSSIKYKLFDMEEQRVLAHGLLEKIGEREACLRHRVSWPDRDGTREGETVETVAGLPMAGHREGLVRIGELLLEKIAGCASGGVAIEAVGHRVVHGGETFRHPVRIDDQVLAAIHANTPLAPLHNPPNLAGIEVAGGVFPGAVQVAVFDTAFHQTMPPTAYRYALPAKFYRENRVRRYGFHGTSHAYVAEAAAHHLGSTPEGVNLITIHLGNGASMAAVREGRCVDTTMGMTPLEGLVMGTRAGDVDPALPFYLSRHLGMSLEAIDDLLNRESGLKGLCGSNDMREIVARRGGGDEAASLAFDLYVYRIRKYIGAFFAVLGQVDAVVFTAGVGENAPEVRRACCSGLEGLGIILDAGRNRQAAGGCRTVSRDGSPVAVMVIPTDEELQIAREVHRLVAPERSNRREKVL